MNEHHGANRREDLRLITEHGRFASDLNFSDQLYAHFVSSDRDHAEIIAVTTAVEDNGTVIAHPIVEGQLRGAAARGGGKYSVSMACMIRGRDSSSAAASWTT